MTNIKLTGHTWDTSGIWDTTEEKTQAQVNSELKTAVGGIEEYLSESILTPTAGTKGVADITYSVGNFSCLIVQNPNATNSVINAIKARVYKIADASYKFKLAAYSITSGTGKLTVTALTNELTFTEPSGTYEDEIVELANPLTIPSGQGVALIIETVSIIGYSNQVAEGYEAYIVTRPSTQVVYADITVGSLLINSSSPLTFNERSIGFSVYSGAVEWKDFITKDEAEVLIDSNSTIVKSAIAPVLTSFIADTALVENDFRFVNDDFYRITASIQSGDPIIPNTNAVKTTVGEVLKVLALVSVAET